VQKTKGHCSTKICKEVTYIVDDKQGQEAGTKGIQPPDICSVPNSREDKRKRVEDDVGLAVFMASASTSGRDCINKP